MKNIRLPQEQWDKAKALFEKFVLAGDGSFVDRETPHQIKAMYQIGNTSVCIGWKKKYRDKPSSNRPVCNRLGVLVEQLIHQTKNSMCELFPCLACCFDNGVIMVEDAVG